MSDADMSVFIHGIVHAKKHKGVGPSGLASEHLCWIMSMTGGICSICEQGETKSGY